MDKYPWATKMAGVLFHHRTTSLTEPEKLSIIESKWISNSFQGGLMYSEDGKYENAICYDQNSMYSHFLNHQLFYIPWKQGKFAQFETLPDIVPYGIYRCKITSDDKMKNRLFRFNKNYFYTHYDIATAKLLGFTISLICDSQSNALLWDSKSRIKSREVYGATIDYLYELKKKIPYVKKFMSSLWGSHCEKETKKVMVKEKEEEVELEDYDIRTIEKYEGCHKVKATKSGNMYKSNYARVGTFLTSYARYNMVKHILDNNYDLENIKRINTDGYIIVNETIKPEQIGKDLGMFKIEKKGDCNIVHVNLVEWEE